MLSLSELKNRIQAMEETELRSYIDSIERHLRGSSGKHLVLKGLLENARRRSREIENA